MSTTKIEWTDRTWNPTRGCALVSEGCRRCYAMKQAHRFSRKGAAYDGLTKLTMNGPHWTGKVVTVPELLDQPLHWRKPARVFVNSMSDLFHEDVPEEFIGHVFATMARCPQHTFQILTKRPQEMLDLIGGAEQRWGPFDGPWPLPNVWLGISCEDQKTADERIPTLLNVPAAIRFVSYEPALGPVNFEQWIFDPMLAGSPDTYIPAHIPGLDWVIAGGESGPGARPFNIQWARDVIAQCKAAGVACFVKQLGSNPYLAFHQSVHKETPGLKLHIEAMDVDTTICLNDRKGGDPSEWPADLRVREFPQ